MKYLDDRNNYECDSCKKVFKGCEAKLIDPSINIKILTPISNFIYVDKEGTIIGGNLPPSLEKEDKLIACPYCKQTHLFGLTQTKGNK